MLVPVLLPISRARRLRRDPLVLWHLLSFDAPTVAALWTFFIASAVRVVLPGTSILAMAVAVWMLYAADRLLDSRQLLSDPLHTGDLEDRHRFHHRHRSAFLVGILVASAGLSVLIPRLSPEAIHLDLILGALLAGYFILIHATGSAHRLPKEIAVGLFFSAAVFIPTVARVPQLRLSLVPAAALFALLCSLNCLFIYAWEHSLPREETTFGRVDVLPRRSTPHVATRFALRHLRMVTWISLVADVALAAWSYSRPGVYEIHLRLWLLPGACAVSTALLLSLHHQRSRFGALSLRAAADLALLTPLLLLAGLQ